MWSIGVITYTMLTGGLPFQSDNLTEVYDLIMNQKIRIYREEWNDLSKHALKFTLGLLEKDVSKRFTPEKALSHNFIKRKDDTDRCIHPKLLEKLANADTNNCFKIEMFTLFTMYLK